MNTDQANKLPLPEIVERIGGKFSHKDSHGSLWYHSPLRQGDSDASFHITQVSNIKLGRIWVWKDFGDEGGSVIDLIRKRYGVDVAGALRVLREDLKFGKADLPPAPTPLLDLLEPPKADFSAKPDGRAAIAIDKESRQSPDTPVFSDVRVDSLSNRALKGYLYGRGIDFWLARPYVKEIHYTKNGQPFFALAFTNDLGDYELRNKYYQGVYGRKAITTICPEMMKDRGTVILFEGFIDFLSYLAWYGLKTPPSPVIVLNSVEMKHQAVQAVHTLNATKVEVYADNDDAGRKLITYLQENLSGIHIEDKSGLYADLGYKDFNDLLKAERTQDRAQIIAR